MRQTEAYSGLIKINVRAGRLEKWGTVIVQGNIF